MSRVVDNVDVICQYKPTGEVIPMRFRILNEDGEYVSYSIKGYRELNRGSSYTSTDGLAVGDKDKVYECRVLILDLYRTVRLYFNSERLKWRLAI